MSTQPPSGVSTRISRRRMLRRSGAVVAAAAMPWIVPASALGGEGKPAVSNRITMGVIGTGNQGINDLRSFLEDERVQVVAVCDVNKESAGYWDGAVAGREPARRLVRGALRRPPSRRAATRAATRTSISARCSIARTSTRWSRHARSLACHSRSGAAKAKKDIYCQKPLSLTIAEGRAMSDAVKKHQRVFQTGSQQRSDQYFRRACELVRNGRIGKLHTVRCGLPGGRPDFGKTGDRKKPEPVPEGFDYDRWLGPAPERPTRRRAAT